MTDLIAKALPIMILGEIIAYVIFDKLWKVLGPAQGAARAADCTPAQRERMRKKQYIEIFKGILERVFVTFGLLMGYPGVLTLFAALKLGNRLRHEEKRDEMSDEESDRVTNYFLIGNILSIMICLTYVILISGDAHGRRNTVRPRRSVRCMCRAGPLCSPTPGMRVRRGFSQGWAPKRSARPAPALLGRRASATGQGL